MMELKLQLEATFKGLLARVRLQLLPLMLNELDWDQSPTHQLSLAKRRTSFQIKIKVANKMSKWQRLKSFRKEAYS